MTPEKTLVLMSFPIPGEAGDPPTGHIPAIAELRRQFGLSLQEAVGIARGSFPRTLAKGSKAEMVIKAEALRQWGCDVALMSKV